MKTIGEFDTSQTTSLQNTSVKNPPLHMFNQPAMTVWFTGLSGSGKSTLAHHLALQLMGSLPVRILDGDVMRTGLCSDLGFSQKDRSENIRRIAEVARLLNESGVTVIAACISPSANDRQAARSIIRAERFIEVYLSTPLAVCERNDPKGLYKKARAGEIMEFTGISAAYDVPQSPTLELDTSTASIQACVASIHRCLDEHWRTGSA